MEKVYFVGLEVLTALSVQFRLMGYDPVWSTESEPTFQRNISPLSSGLKSKPRKKPA
jgi:hypothetical protein